MLKQITANFISRILWVPISFLEKIFRYVKRNIQKYFDYTSKTNIQEGIRSFYEWYKNFKYDMHFQSTYVQ